METGGRPAAGAAGPDQVRGLWERRPYRPDGRRRGGAQAQGIGFAIPSNLARDIARQIIASGHVTDSLRAAPGAQVDAVTGPGNAPAGAGIVAVAGGGPSAKPGCVLAT